MKLLVIRFSALGDVAMTVPVIDSLAKQYPNLSITMLSKNFVAPLFAQMPSNLHFKGVNLNDYKGLIGLYRLYNELKQERFDAIADIHDVLRTKVLRSFFALSGVKTAHIDKGRTEKKALCRAKGKRLVQLKTSIERYVDVFQSLGLPVKIQFRSIYGQQKGDASLFDKLAKPIGNERWIGFAPFATHQGKVLPIATTSEVINRLCDDTCNRLFLFGGGQEEIKQLQALAEGKSQVKVVAGQLKMNGELALMSHLGVMVSMDSANMHLASLVGIPVVSVWGATHPYAGFMGWRQSENLAIQKDLDCRPCSIFGNKPCLRGDYACLNNISAQEIVSKVKSLFLTSHEKNPR